MYRKIALILCLLLMLVVSQISAAGDSYYLQVDDRLYISVWGHNDLNQETTIGPDGKLGFPLIGEIRAAGLKVSELRELMAEGLSRYLKDPEISIRLLEYQQLTVLVLGEVNHPGSYRLKKGQRVMDAISTAGGLSPGAAPTVNYISGDQKELLALEKMLQGQEQANPLVSNNDIIFIPEASYQVTIAGQVNRPGSYPWRKDLRLMDLLALAGNQTERGNLKDVKIVHLDQTAELIDLKEFLSNNKRSANPLLKAGDMVIINEKKTVDWEKVFFFITGLNALKNLLGID